jgi:peptidoglycan hydrolase FlgJ
MTESILPLSSDLTAMSARPMISAKATGSANINAAAQDFEAMFATQLLQPMFNTIRVNETFGGGAGEEVMRSFMLQEYGKVIAKTGVLGIAPQVRTEMLRIQESARAKAAIPIPVEAQAPTSPPTAKEANNVSY